MTNWTELKRLAEEATGGDWEFRLGLIRTKHDSDGYVPVAVAPNSPKSWRNQRDLNMQFIAAANPKTILAMIAENERLRDIANEQRHRLECLCEGTDGSTPALTRIGRLEYERDQLRAEVEALRKDADRYRHLKDQGHFRAMSIDMGGNHSWTGMGRHVGKGSTVDETIDSEIARIQT